MTTFETSATKKLTSSAEIIPFPPERIEPPRPTARRVLTWGYVWVAATWKSALDLSKPRDICQRCAKAGLKLIAEAVEHETKGEGEAPTGEHES